MTVPAGLLDLSEQRGFSTLGEQVARLQQYSLNPQQRIRTGFHEIDSLIEGPAKGEICTIIAPTYTGKSILAQNIMLNNADKPAIFFSLEMPTILALQRLLAMHTGIPNNDIQAMTSAGQLPPDLAELPDHFNNHVIIDKSGLGPADMMDYIDGFEEVFGVRPAFICVDYLELVGGVKTSGDGWAALEAAAQAMKDMAKEADIPVFMLHQTNRTGHKPWKAPTMNDARGGGVTEADFIVGMWRPHLDPDLPQYERDGLENEMHLTVLKNRVFGRHNREPIRLILEDSLRLTARRY